MTEKVDLINALAEEILNRGPRTKDEAFLIALRELDYDQEGVDDDDWSEAQQDRMEEARKKTGRKIYKMYEKVYDRIMRKREA